jgi:hypothetical protein
VLLGAILETPELVERLTEVLKPAPAANGRKGRNGKKQAE